VKLLMTLPGISLAVAQTFVAALGNIDRFRSPDEAASYLGLVPSTRQSADHCYHGPITKAGRGHARWMLIQAAHHLYNQPGPLGVFFRRVAKKKNYNVAVVAAARKMVVIAWHMLKHNEPYRYAQPKQTEIKLARLRVKATGERRNTGPARGTKRQTKRPAGSQTIKSLAKVYQQEGLPGLQLPKEAERRMLRSHGVAPFADSLATEHILPGRRDKHQAVKK
jgi:hypothetical protein